MGTDSPYKTYQILAIQPQEPAPQARTRAQCVSRARKLATAKDGHSRGENVLLVEIDSELLVRWYMRFNGAGERGVRMGRREGHRGGGRRRRRRWWMNGRERRGVPRGCG
jgi:hypothetical protein